MTENPQVVSASHYVRTMRGGAHAALIEAVDGHHYVVKFLQNPQGLRILINELICSLLFSRVGVFTPEVALIAVDDEFLRRNPDCPNQQVGVRFEARAGIHFGSRYPGTPNSATIYDFLPRTMLPVVYNRSHFLGALVLDKWVSNADSRQAIFYRAMVNWDGRTSPEWVVSMIDNGNAFQGVDWMLLDSDPQGLYFCSMVYGEPVNPHDFEPWIDAMMSIGRQIVDEVFALVPREWIGNDDAELLQLLTRLLSRRSRVRDLVGQSVEWMNAREMRSRPAEIPDPKCTRRCMEASGNPTLAPI